MKKIVWTKEYSVGVKSLDEQHIKIIELINTLIDHHNDGVKSETIADVLQQMVKYAQNHLDYEEELLEKHHYPKLMQHASIHIEYLKNVADFSFDILGKSCEKCCQISSIKPLKRSLRLKPADCAS